MTRKVIKCKEGYVIQVNNDIVVRILSLGQRHVKVCVECGSDKLISFSANKDTDALPAETAVVQRGRKRTRQFKPQRRDEASEAQVVSQVLEAVLGAQAATKATNGGNLQPAVTVLEKEPA